MIVTLIYGDGIGYEVINATREIIDAATNVIEWDVQVAGADILEQYGTPLPEGTVESIKRNKIALKGPTGTPVGEGFRSVNVEIRKRLDLYANLRPIKSFKGVEALHNDLDIVIVRENTEGLYIGQEEMIDDDTALTKKIITGKASERIVKFTFDYAQRNDRKRVTAVHKANIMKLTDGLFLKSAKKIAQDYNAIEFNDKIIDALCMDMVMDPYKYDVLVAPNFYGDILSDLCAGLVGGLGYAPGANIGDDIAVFEAVHGTAPDIVGLGIANPTSAILSGCMMLGFMGLKNEEKLIENALKMMYQNGKQTYSINGKLNTNKFKDEIIKLIKNNA
ncbi:MAG: isocitrate/isopropylmalate dehydrogenase family protein [Dethiosulfatibacter sp.]|nr:isocitrate/isopropylmalate dehydrogenase family protein [Dethiosulfatibacter sp.]